MSSIINSLASDPDPPLSKDETSLAKVLAGKRVLAEYRQLEQACKDAMHECLAAQQKLRQLRQKRRDLIREKKAKKKEAKQYGDLRRTRY
jgi:hypothetical protein